MANEDPMFINVRKKIIFTSAASWKRVLAFILDYLFLNSFILFPFNSLISRVYPSGSFKDIMNMFTGAEISFAPIIATSVFMGIITLIYFIIFERVFNQTIGKMILGIIVTDIHSNLKNIAKVRPNTWRIFLRSLSVITLYAMPFIFVADCVYAYFNPEGQRFCEKISRTRTIEIAAI